MQLSLNCDLLFYYYHESNVETDATTGTAEISEFVIKHPSLPTLSCTDVYCDLRKWHSVLLYVFTKICHLNNRFTINCAKIDKSGSVPFVNEELTAKTAVFLFPCVFFFHVCILNLRYSFRLNILNLIVIL